MKKTSDIKYTFDKYTFKYTIAFMFCFFKARIRKCVVKMNLYFDFVKLLLPFPSSISRLQLRISLPPSSLEGTTM